MSGGAGAGSGDDDADRKRLKERLKGALDTEKRRKIHAKADGEAFLEYVFGICRPDRRVGKLGSRCVSRMVGRPAAMLRSGALWANPGR